MPRLEELAAFATLQWPESDGPAGAFRGFAVLENLCVTIKHQGYIVPFLSLVAQTLAAAGLPNALWVDVDVDNVRSMRVFERALLGPAHTIPFAAVPKSAWARVHWLEPRNRSDLLASFVFPEQALGEMLRDKNGCLAMQAEEEKRLRALLKSK